jgi:hypothetical protein
VAGVRNAVRESDAADAGYHLERLVVDDRNFVRAGGGNVDLMVGRNDANAGCTRDVRISVRTLPLSTSNTIVRPAFM